MTRHALIIGSPDSSIPGVLDDMRNYRDFLLSASGGGWYSHEVTTLKSPSAADVKSQLTQIKSNDYTFVIFAGHGSYSTAKNCTMLELRKGEEIEDYVLKFGAAKHTLIVDSCRVISRQQVIRKAFDALSASAPTNVSACRAAFDRALRSAAPGLATMYSCAIGETAGDIEGVGGRYSSSLLSAAENWAKLTWSEAVLSVSDAHEASIPLVHQGSGGHQNPKGEFPRTIPRFPFAVRSTSYY